MADYSGGRILLTVSPSFRGVQQQISAEAARWGSVAASTFAQAFEREVGKIKLPAPTGLGATQGAESGKQFAAGFRREVESGLRNMPTPTIRVDISEAQRDIQKLRDELARLSGATVKLEVNSSAALSEINRVQEALRRLTGVSVRIDINSAAVLAEIATIQRELARLGAMSPTVRVDTDTAAATAELIRLEALIARINGTRIRVGAGAGSLGGLSNEAAASQRSLSGMATAAALLGPAIIPVAAAATVAIAAIGQAALASVAGIGVLAVAFHGVGAAVSAMAEAHASAAKDASSAAQAQRAQADSITSAQRQVAQAEAGVTQARQAAADSAVDAARRVTDAQAAVTQASADAGRTAIQSARAVAQAQRSLADAQENAARSAETSADRIAKANAAYATATQRAAKDVQSALRQQETAERSLSGALDDERDAQLALTQAREDAQNQLEDIDFQVRKGLLDQRQAVLDLADAKREYDDITHDSASSDTEREQASIKYEEAKTQLEQLGVENERLAEKQADAAKKGVEGSDLVVTAQDRIAQATQHRQDAERAAADAAKAVVDAQVAGAQAIADAQDVIASAQEDAARSAIASARSISDAEQGVTDAVDAQTLARVNSAQKIADAEQSVTDALRGQQRQQEQSAFAIAGSLASLEGAQAALAKATTDTGDAGSASLDKLKKALDALSPAGQAFAQFIYSLAPAWRQVQGAAQGGLLPGVEDGIRSLLPFLPQVTAFVGQLSGVLGDLAASAGRALAGPEWAAFFGYIRDTAGPTLQLLAPAIGDIALGFANLMVAFRPLSEQFNSGFASMAQSFADWSKSLSDNQGFQSFLGYLKESGPLVSDTIMSLGRAIANIVVALAPIGTVVLQVIGYLADFIASVDPDILTAVAVGIMAVVLAFQATAAIMAIAAAGTALVVAAITAAVVAVVAGLVYLYQNSETFRDIVNTAFGAVRDFIVDVVWEKGLKPTFQAIADFWRNELAPAAVWLWKNVLQPAFEGIATAVKWAWEQVIQPALSALVWYWQNVIAPVANWLWKNIIKPAFEGIAFVVQVNWEVMRLIFDLLVYTFQHVIAPVVNWLWQNVFKPAFDGIGASVKDVWENILTPVFNALRGFFENTLGPAVSKGVGAFTSAWNAMKKAAADPINFVINEVYTGGIKKLFDQVASAVHSDARLPDIKPVGYARGGLLPGSSSWRDGDDQLVPMRRGEGVAVSEAMRVPEAREQLLRWNSLALQGGPSAVSRYMRQGYSKGGIVDLLAFARRVQAMGYDVGENKALGDNPQPGVHANGSYHYKFDNSGAVDVNHGAGTSAAEQAALAKVVPLAAEYGLRTIFMVKDHFNHAHFDVGAASGAGNMLGDALSKLGDFASSAFGSIKGALGSAWDSATDALSPFTDLIGKIAGGVGDSPMGQLTGAAARQTFSMATDWVKNAVGSLFGTGGEDATDTAGYTGSRGVEQWRSTALQALQITGSPASWVGSLLRRMQQESSGDPRSINLTDSNAIAGHPSKGLMQEIDSTFRAYALPGYNTNVYDPLSNIIASIRYANSRYGSAPKGWDRKGGYAEGGLVQPALYDNGGIVPPGYSTVLNATRQPEALLNPQQWADIRVLAMDRSTGASRPGLTVNAYGAREDVLAAKVVERLHQAELLQYP